MVRKRWTVAYSPPMVSRGAAPFWLLGLMLGCAGTAEAPDPAADATLPQAADLGELASLAAPTEPLPRGVTAVDQWRLHGAPPEQPDWLPVSLDAPWEEPLRDFVATQTRNVVPTESQRCIARELAWFHLEQRANPDDGWMTFVQSRCLSTTTFPRVHFLEGEVPPGTANEEILTAWREQLDELLEKQLQNGPWAVGIGFARQAGRVVIVMTSAREQVRLEHFDATFPRHGRVSVIGHALGPAEHISAVVGIGELGAGVCVPHPGASPPAFHFVCEADPSDPWNFLSIMIKRPGRVLTEAGALLVVRSPGEPATEFRRRFFTSPYEPGPRESLDDVIAAELNRVRARVGLGPLEPSPAQARVASRLAPHYLAAVQGQPAPDGRPATEVLELVGQGMVAGWDVDGVVAGGAFCSARTPKTRDVSRLLSAALQHPSDRIALLDPAATQIAVGAVADPEGGLGAVFGSYWLLDGETLHQAAGGLLGQLIAERAVRGLPAPSELRGVDTLAMQAASRVEAGEDRQKVLDELLAASNQALRIGVSGYGLEVSGLDEVRFPPELLTEPQVGVAVGLAAFRSSGAARGHWIVFLVAAPLGGSL